MHHQAGVNLENFTTGKFRDILLTRTGHRDRRLNRDGPDQTYVRCYLNQNLTPKSNFRFIHQKCRPGALSTPPPSRTPGHEFALMGLVFIYLALPSAYTPSCIRPEVRFTLDQRVLCSDCCKKCKLLCLAQEVFSYFLLHRSKIPLVLTTKVTHLRSLLFREPDGVNSVVVRRVYFGVIP